MQQQRVTTTCFHHRTLLFRSSFHCRFYRNLQRRPNQGAASTGVFHRRHLPVLRAPLRSLSQHRHIMPFGFLCCGPSTENNVYYSSEDDSSSDESGPGAATAEVVRWAHGAQDRDLFPVEAPSVLPSSIKTAMPKIRKIESSGAASRGIRQPSSSDADGDGWKERPVSTVREVHEFCCQLFCLQLLVQCIGVEVFELWA